MHRRNRLHWRIWLAVLAGLAVFAVLGALGWKLLGERPYHTQRQIFAELAAGVLPPAGASGAELRAALEHWSPRLRSHLALYAADGTPLAATRPDMPRPPLERPDEDWVRGPGGSAFVMQLTDGRFLLASRLSGGGGPPLGMLTALVLLALAVGAATYPVARRLTRRLERLQASVERLGGGDLSARVKIEGRDEIAQLAASFNRAAERIEDLVRAQKSLLANASHELRSPLARVRMAVEMLKDSTDAMRADRLRAEVERNIVELDALIEEILLASRLEATDVRAGFGPVDLAALAADTAAQARVPAQLPAGPLTVQGDARLLRRLLRNLLENAERHGGGGIELTLAAEQDAAVLCVLDRGPGVPAAERQRIFEPFYRVAGRAESAGGVGLGLALVRRIAEQHGGSVVCEPRAGGGSVFRVMLPRR